MSAYTRRQLATAFGRVLRAARDAAGLTQEQVAEVAGIDRTYPSLLERGLRQPTLYVIVRIAEALQTDPGLIVNVTTTALRADLEKP